MPFYYSLASVPGGLVVKLPLEPDDVKYVPKKLVAVGLDGHEKRIGLEGRILSWSQIDTFSFSALWEAGGGDLADSANGYIRCPAWGANGESADTWEDYECVITKPTEGNWEVRGVRGGVKMTIRNMVRYRVSPP